MIPVALSYQAGPFDARASVKAGDVAQLEECALSMHSSTLSGCGGTGCKLPSDVGNEN